MKSIYYPCRQTKSKRLGPLVLTVPVWIERELGMDEKTRLRISPRVWMDDTGIRHYGILYELVPPDLDTDIIII